MTCLQQYGLEVHWRNVIAVSVAFSILQATAAAGFSVQSTLNMDNGLGLITLTCVYVSAALSCFYSAFVAKKLGTKWTLLTAIICYCTFIAGNLHPDAYILIPTALILGFASGPFWAAEATHIMSTAISYASKTSQKTESVISLFNGIFYGAYLLGQFPGSLMISLMLRKGGSANPNQTSIDKSTLLMSCGARDNCGFDLPNFENTSFNEKYDIPDALTRNTMFVVLLVVGLMSFPIGFLFIDRLETYCNELPTKKEKVQRRSQRNSFLSYRFLLVAPLILFLGFETSFMLADITKVNDGV